MNELTHKRVLRIGHWLAIVTFVVVSIYDAGELVKEMREHEAATSASVFAVATDLSARYNSCKYYLLFFCDDSSTIPGCDKATSLARAACKLSDNGNFSAEQTSNSFWRSIPLVGLVAGAAITLPKIPDATIHMLKDRWGAGRLQFTVGLLFLFAWVALMVLALRRESPENLLWFAGAIVFGPYLLMGGFWLLQLIFDKAASGIDAIAAYVVSIVGLPGCVLLCTAHDAKEAAELIKAGRHIPKV
jgi:hypothetical protein